MTHRHLQLQMAQCQIGMDRGEERLPGVVGRRLFVGGSKGETMGKPMEVDLMAPGKPRENHWNDGDV